MESFHRRPVLFPPVGNRAERRGLQLRVPPTGGNVQRFDPASRIVPGLIMPDPNTKPIAPMTSFVPRSRATIHSPAPPRVPASSVRSRIPATAVRASTNGWERIPLLIEAALVSSPFSSRMTIRSCRQPIPTAIHPKGHPLPQTFHSNKHSDWPSAPTATHSDWPSAPTNIPLQQFRQAIHSDRHSKYDLPHEHMKKERILKLHPHPFPKRFLANHPDNGNPPLAANRQNPVSHCIAVLLPKPHMQAEIAFYPERHRPELNFFPSAMHFGCFHMNSFRIRK